MSNRKELPELVKATGILGTIVLIDGVPIREIARQRSENQQEN